ncbi:MAG: hypothetical protein ABDH21_00110 [bacterium]
MIVLKYVTKITAIAVIIILFVNFLLDFKAFSFNSMVRSRILFAPSMENLKGVLSLSNSEYLIFGNTKSFTETSDDWMLLKVNSNFDILRLSIFSGSFSDKIGDVVRFGDNLLAVGNTWSFRRESLDDIMVSYFDKDMNLMGFYVISGSREDKAFKIFSVNNQPYLLSSTRSAGFGSTCIMVSKLGSDLYPTNFWVIGSVQDQEPLDIIELSPNKYLIVSSYLKMSGNKDCLLAVVDSNFNVTKAFAFGGAFDENLVSIVKKSKERFYFIFETRSFKPQDKMNILISSFRKTDLSHARSFAFGTMEEERYLSHIFYQNNLYVLFYSMINKQPTIGVIVLDSNLGYKGSYTINSFFNLSNIVYSFYPIDQNIWVINYFNVNTLEDVGLIRTENMVELLPPIQSKPDFSPLKLQRYYIKVARYPNIESYPVGLQTQEVSPDSFVVSNEIQVNYFDADYSTIWR